MKQFELHSLTFQSYVYLSFVMAASIGLILGIFLLIMSPFTTEAAFKFQEYRVEGFLGGLMNAIYVPSMIGLFGAIVGIFGYWPFRLLMKIQKKLKLRGEFTFE